MKRTANAIWSGDLKAGKGTFGLGSGALSDHPYSFKTRFENEDGKAGTNPEELIAAAHASCFAMQLSAFLAEKGHPAEKLEVEAQVTLVPGYRHHRQPSGSGRTCAGHERGRFQG